MKIRKIKTQKKTYTDEKPSAFIVCSFIFCMMFYIYILILVATMGM